MINKIQRSYEMRQSPFHDSKLQMMETDKKISVKLPKKAYIQFMEYSKEHNGITKDSEAFRKLCFSQLDKICNERKIFNNLECYMLIPKTDDLDKLNFDSEIIAIVNTECDYIDGFNPSSKFNESFNLTYDLTYFIQEEFPSDLLFNTKDSCVYHVEKNKLNNFYVLQSELYRLYPHLNDCLDGCYFVRFPLNNFLDIKRDGEFQHKSSEYNQHEGLYVFSDMLNNRNLYCIIDWKYNHDINKMYFSFHFESERVFIRDIHDFDDGVNGEHREELRQSISEIIESRMHNMNYLLGVKESLEKDLAFVNNLIDNVSSNDD